LSHICCDCDCAQHRAINSEAAATARRFQSFYFVPASQHNQEQGQDSTHFSKFYCRLQSIASLSFYLSGGAREGERRHYAATAAARGRAAKSATMRQAAILFTSCTGGGCSTFAISLRAMLGQVLLLQLLFDLALSQFFELPQQLILLR
jgi:hypothetical protein